jgi:hypothetical protein
MPPFLTQTLQHTENLYIPPDSDVKLIEDCLNSLEQNLRTQLYCEIVLGDFNVTKYDWPNGTTLSKFNTIIKSKEI